MSEIRYDWEFRSTALDPDVWLEGDTVEEPSGSGWQPIGVSGDGLMVLWARKAPSNWQGEKALPEAEVEPEKPKGRPRKRRGE